MNIPSFSANEDSAEIVGSLQESGCVVVTDITNEDSRNHTLSINQITSFQENSERMDKIIDALSVISGALTTVLMVQTIRSN